LELSIKWFATYKFCNFGDGAHQGIMGMGDIKIKTQDGDKLVNKMLDMCQGLGETLCPWQEFLNNK
jgi:hypothetical protein